jgi:hypothetical protein
MDVHCEKEADGPGHEQKSEENKVEALAQPECRSLKHKQAETPNVWSC